MNFHESKTNAQQFIILTPDMLQNSGDLFEPGRLYYNLELLINY